MKKKRSFSAANCNYRQFFIAALILGQVEWRIDDEATGLDANNAYSYIILILLGLAGFGIYMSMRRVARQYRIGAHTSFTCVHMFGIPHVPEMSMASLFITYESLII